MTSLDQYQYNNDKTLCSPEDQFKPLGDDSFFLNTKNILSQDHVVTTGKTYVLFEYVQGKLTSATPVVLKNVLDTNVGIHVSLVDMLTQEVQVRTVKVGNAASIRQWKLCDLDILVNANNLDIVENVKAGNEGELLEFCF